MASEAVAKAEILAKKRALAAAALQHVPPVRIPELLQDKINQLLREHPGIDLQKAISRMESVKSFWADEELACSRNLKPLNPGAPKEKISPQVLAVEQGPMKYLLEDAVAYVAKNMASSYAAHYRVLSEIKRRIPDFQPRQILDFGPGPGTSIWAIRELWPDQLQQAVLVETSAAMTGVCDSLTKGITSMPVMTPVPLLPNAGSYPPASLLKNNLVIAAFSMNELPSMVHRMAVVNYLWKLTRDILVIIEPGTLHGSALVRRIRNKVLITENHRVRSQYKGLYLPTSLNTQTGRMLGAHVVAPCAHDGECPLSKSETGGICGMIQAMENEKVKKLDKSTFSFVVLRRGFRHWGAWPLDKYKKDAPDEEPDKDKDQVADLYGGWMRITRPPTKLGNSVTIPVCMPVGKSSHSASLEELKIKKEEDLGLYSLAKEVEMGDLWPR